MVEISQVSKVFGMLSKNFMLFVMQLEYIKRGIQVGKRLIHPRREIYVDTCLKVYSSQSINHKYQNSLLGRFL